ncbi:hypothetical protein [Rathayibacter sp. VKM Ac-2630]|uniref:hypothetical protein n=1 Tax=Rathayibacter sp. VKM Ac-2630 TaxID=1938617 RepID=UPI001F365902|nr:hypothetical protein [Rathayibacter sp. VKM Ac-2630]
MPERGEAIGDTATRPERHIALVADAATDDDDVEGGVGLTESAHDQAFYNS